jgi:hypothetical protein
VQVGTRDAEMGAFQSGPCRHPPRIALEAHPPSLSLRAYGVDVGLVGTESENVDMIPARNRNDRPGCDGYNLHLFDGNIRRTNHRMQIRFSRRRRRQSQVWRGHRGAERGGHLTRFHGNPGRTVCRPEISATVATRQQSDNVR